MHVLTKKMLIIEFNELNKDNLLDACEWPNSSPEQFFKTEVTLFCLPLIAKRCAGLDIRGCAGDFK